jgi:hypothetical protein
MDSDGNFVVVWMSFGSSGSDTSGDSIQGQLYNSVGIPQGNQFQVNTYTTSYQHYPSVALDSDGDFVVIWRNFSGTSIQGQRYNSAGAPQGGQFQVNTYNTNDQVYPSVAIDSDGDFVVVWDSLGSSGSDTDDWSIQGQRYNSAGIPQGTQFQVNTYTTNYQRQPAVSLENEGDFVVVWESYGSVGNDTAGYSIQGQRYNSDGVTQGSQFQVNTYTTGNRTEPAVALDSDGDFVVVWKRFPNYLIAARLFSLQPTDVSLVTPQPADPSPILPRFTLFALLSTFFVLLAAIYHHLRQLHYRRIQ